jgi:hypothetical protein
MKKINAQYIIPFLGVAKLLGVLPGYKKSEEADIIQLPLLVISSQQQQSRSPTPVLLTRGHSGYPGSEGDCSLFHDVLPAS